MPLIVAGVLVAAACVTTLVSRSHADGVRASDLHVTEPYVPQPASPDVAAAYFTITNSGSRPAVLTGVGSDVSAMSMMHENTGTTMRMLGPMTVPAHGELVFSPGRYHVMLESPTRTLKQGDRVRLTLSFEGAGQITVDAPVMPVGYHPVLPAQGR
jgi:copper(I)-binding protein